MLDDKSLTMLKSLLVFSPDVGDDSSPSSSSISKVRGVTVRSRGFGFPMELESVKVMDDTLLLKLS